MKYRRPILSRSSALCGRSGFPFLAALRPSGLPPLPQRQRIPHFPAVAEAPELAVPHERCFPGYPGPPLLATTAAKPAFSCRCGSPGTGRAPRGVLPRALRSSAPCHNGSESRIFLPLWKLRNWPCPARGASRGTLVLRPLPQRQQIPHFPAVAEIRCIHIVTMHFRYMAIC